MTALRSLHATSAPPGCGRPRLCAAASLLASGCVSVTPPPEVVRAAAANPELSLHLVDPIHWHLFEVQPSTLERAWTWSRSSSASRPASGVDLGADRRSVVGRHHSLARPAGVPAPAAVLERYRHSAEYWFRNPWGDIEWMIVAHGASRRAVSFPATRSPGRAAALPVHRRRRHAALRSTLRSANCPSTRRRAACSSAGWRARRSRSSRSALSPGTGRNPSSSST